MARQRPEQRRAELVAVGRKMFSTHPYDAVSTDDIAAEAGISKGLMYHYFAGKRELYVATVRASAADLLTAVPLVAGELERSLDGFVGFLERDGAFFRALLRGGIGVDAEVAAVVEGVRTELLARLVGEDAPPMRMLRLRGWLGLVEATSLDWIERRSCSTQDLRSFWLEALAFAESR